MWTVLHLQSLNSLFRLEPEGLIDMNCPSLDCDALKVFMLGGGQHACAHRACVLWPPRPPWALFKWWCLCFNMCQSRCSRRVHVRVYKPDAFASGRSHRQLIMEEVHVERSGLIILKSSTKALMSSSLGSWERCEEQQRLNDGSFQRPEWLKNAVLLVQQEKII